MKPKREFETELDEIVSLNRMMCHDIRDDIGIVTGRVAELSDRLDADDARTLEEIVRAANHVLHMSRSFSEVLDVVGQPESPEEYAVDVNQVLRAEIVKAEQLYQGAEIELEAGDDPMHVRADGLIASVFSNLISHGLRYNDKFEPQIRIDGRMDSDFVVITIADNGPSTPDVVRENLFTDDVRIDPAGSGVELSLVYRLVERYGGSIWAEAREPVGTIFVVKLPRIDGNE